MSHPVCRRRPHHVVAVGVFFGFILKEIHQNDRFKILVSKSGRLVEQLFGSPSFFFEIPGATMEGRTDGDQNGENFPKKPPWSEVEECGFSGWSDLGGETLQFPKATHAGNGSRADFVIRSEIGPMGKLCLFHSYKWSYGPRQGKLPTPPKSRSGGFHEQPKRGFPCLLRLRQLSHQGADFWVNFSIPKMKTHLLAWDKALGEERCSCFFITRNKNSNSFDLDHMHNS